MTNVATENEQSGLSSKSKKYYIHSAVGLVIMFFFGFLPPFGPVTPLGMKYLGIFLGLIYLWSFVDMGWPILASFAAVVVLDCMPITQIFTQAFANYTMLLCLLTMLVIMSLSETGIFNYVAAWLLKQPFLQGHPWRITIALIAICYVGNAFQLGGIAVLFFAYELTFQICDMCNMKRSHSWCGAVITVATISCIIGNATLPFTAMSLFYVSVFAPVQAFEWPFLQYVFFIVCTELIIVAFFLLCMKLLRVDMSALKEADISGFTKKIPPMTAYQKKASIIFLSFVVCLVLAGLSSQLPVNPITAFLGKLGLIGVSWIFMCIMVIWRVHDKAAFTLTGMAAKVPWDSLLIICMCMCLGPAISSEETGVGALLYQLTAPIFGGHSEFVFLVMVCLVTLIMTNFLNNTVVTLLMVNVIVAMAPTMNLNIITVAALMFVASEMAMFLPGSSFYAALVHGQAEYTGRKSGFLWGGVVVLCTALAIPILVIIGNMLF